MNPFDDPQDPHCSEILQRMFFFIDNELDGADCQEIQQHLTDCQPCLEKYDIERTVKSLVQRSCAEHAPEDLRAKVLWKIRQAHLGLGTEQQQA